MTRAEGGGPANSRALRRASLPAENFFRLVLRFLKGRSRLAHYRTIVNALRDGGSGRGMFDEFTSRTGFSLPGRIIDLVTKTRQAEACPTKRAEGLRPR